MPNVFNGEIAAKRLIGTRVKRSDISEGRTKYSPSHTIRVLRAPNRRDHPLNATVSYGLKYSNCGSRGSDNQGRFMGTPLVKTCLLIFVYEPYCPISTRTEQGNHILDNGDVYVLTHGRAVGFQLISDGTPGPPASSSGPIFRR